MLVPVGNKVGLTCVSLGVIRAIEQKGTAVTFFKPIDKFTGGHPKGSTNNILKTQKNIKQLPSLSLDYAETMISSNSLDNLLEEVLESFNKIKNKSAINIIEIWDKEKYEKAIDDATGDFADLAEEVMGQDDDDGVS